MVPGGLPGMEAPGATASMICGIIAVVLAPIGCFCGFLEIAAIPLGIVAVVLGFRARRAVAQSMASGTPRGGGGKALAGIITGFVGIGWGLIWGAILLLLVIGVNLLPSFVNSFPSPSP
jgi:hypothetical protein